MSSVIDQKLAADTALPYRIMLEDGRPAVGVAGGGHERPFSKDEVDDIRARLVACWNACAGIKTDYLETLIRESSSIHHEMMQRIQNKTAAENARARAEQRRDELLAALERLSFAALSRDATMGDQCNLIAVKAELVAANKQAMDAIAKVKSTHTPCPHPNTITQHTGDGTPVDYCPDCGRNEVQR